MKQEIGTLRLTYIDEITTPEVTQATKELIESIKKAGRNWTPVIVVQTGSEEYEVLSGAEILEACKEAGLTKVWTIIADDSEETKEAVNAENKVNKVAEANIRPVLTETIMFIDNSEEVEVKEVAEKTIGFELNTTYKSDNGLGTITVVDIDGLTDDDNQYVLYAKDEEKTEEYLISLSPSYGYFITHEKYGTIYATDKA